MPSEPPPSFSRFSVIFEFRREKPAVGGVFGHPFSGGLLRRGVIRAEMGGSLWRGGRQSASQLYFCVPFRNHLYCESCIDAPSCSSRLDNYPTEATRILLEKPKKEAYHRISKPFKGDTHGELEVTWLDNSREQVYKASDRILLEHEDMNGLIFFYLYVFNQLHRSLVQFVMSSGFKTKKFDDYILKPTFFAITDEGKKINLTFT